jgi:hypothetical protein
MKKFLIVTGLLIPFSLFSQNIQLHYDLGEGRNYLTSTVEMFRPDKYGSTFFFTDMDYNVGDVEGVSLAYWEIARASNFGDSPLAFHAEYNGGFGQWRAGNEGGAYTIESAWLTGLEYSKNASDFSKGFTLQALYKYIRGKHDFSFQLTGVWYLNFARDKFSFTGYADFWREDFEFGTAANSDITKFVFQAEPQLWYNLNSGFALGGEVEVDYNFLFKGLHLYPTIGAKVTF